jgi:dTDP-4-dehydrorhamnose reductase
LIRLLLTGRNGQVGFELARTLQTLGEVVALDQPDCDLSDAENVTSLLDAVRPEVIVNTAAFTAVDLAESQEDLAFRINAEAPAAMARWARSNGAAMLHYSTDYVFDGRTTKPWRESERIGPLSAYGRSKAAGETAILDSGAPAIILRTSWVYANRGQNFVRTMLRLAREREEIKVVNDQLGAPTWARSVAEATAQILARAGRDADSVRRNFEERGGIFHLTASGATTWYEFAKRVFDGVADSQRRLKRLVPIATTEYSTPAQRPMYSLLDNSRVGEIWGIRMPQWEQALNLCLEDWQP